MIIDGENLAVMQSLSSGAFNLRGKVDMLLWEPPYNKGTQDFRYIAGAGDSMKKEDGYQGWVHTTDPSRHTKWLNFMATRLMHGKLLLKNSGVIAIHIDGTELFRLGMLMDEIFGEENRLGLINWQKTFVAKADARHISDATEYVLIYEKRHGEAERSALLPRSEAAAGRYLNPDNDPLGPWAELNPKASTASDKGDYGIQSPFTGKIFYPGPGQSWRHKKANLLAWLSEWGTDFVEMEDVQCSSPSLVISGTMQMMGSMDTPPGIMAEARQRAMVRRGEGNWPKIIFLGDGEGSPMIKKHLSDVQAGRVPMSFFRTEEYLSPLAIGTQGWNHEESGHHNGSTEMLRNILGGAPTDEAPKPLQLTEKLIHLYCPPEGTVLDAFGGTATTAHAVLSLNHNMGTNRRFILIENGQGDIDFCNRITAERTRRVITGTWERTEATALGGGFTYFLGTHTITRASIHASDRGTLVDMILQSHPSTTGQADCRIQFPGLKYMVGRTRDGSGIALVGDGLKSLLNPAVLEEIKTEARTLNLGFPLFIYAMINQGPNGSDNYIFSPIPDAILTPLHGLD